MDFKSLLYEFLDSDFLVYAGYVYLFALIFYAVYSALNYFKYYSRMQKTLMSLYSRMSEQEKLRAQLERQERDIHGAGKKADFLSRLDEELAYSGIRDKIKWMTTELYIIILVTVTALAVMIATVIKGALVGILVGSITVILFKLVLVLLSNNRNRTTESIMMQFMNIVDNFSKTSDDLISILERSSRYIDEPLSSQIYNAVLEARNSGDSFAALQDLQDKVKNKHFKVLIKNLEITSRLETNYSDIIADIREIFHAYIKSEKEKRTIRINGIIEIGLMLACGLLCFVILSDITEQGNIVTLLLLGGTLGHILLGYLIFTVIISLYIAVFQILKDDSSTK